MAPAGMVKEGAPALPREGGVTGNFAGGNVRRRRAIVGLCAVCAFISYADRVNLSVAIVSMSEG